MYSEKECNEDKILDKIVSHCFPNQLITGVVPLIHIYLTRKLQQTSNIEFVDYFKEVQLQQEDLTSIP